MSPPSLPTMVTSSSLLLLLPILLSAWLLFSLLRHIYTAFFGPLSKVPGPRWRAFSIVPQLRSMWTGDEALSALRLHAKYGPVVRLAPDLVAHIGDGSTWKTIYGSKSQGHCVFHKDLIFYDKPFSEVAGVFGSPDPVSLRMRKTMAPAFSDSGLKLFEPRFKAWCKALASRLEQQATDGTPADMVKLFNCTTFDVMSDMLLSEPLHLLEKGDYVPFVRLIFTILRHVTRLKTVRYYSRTFAEQLHLMLMRIPSIRGYAERHHRFITDRVQERLTKTNLEQPDIWSLVTAETDTASLISEEERYSIANELMIAGTETSATVLSGCMYLLLQNREWLSALTEDIRSKYSPDADGTDKITMASLQANKLLEAIFKESMRLYPPVPIGFPRFVPPGGVHLNGYYMPEGTRVIVYHLATYRDPSLWHEPASFHPERWLGDEKFKNDNFDAFEPFSLGLRGCSGKNFAWNEMRLILATILLNFDFELRPESADWSKQKVFMVWEKPALMVDVKKRST